MLPVMSIKLPTYTNLGYLILPTKYLKLLYNRSSFDLIIEIRAYV